MSRKADKYTAERGESDPQKEKSSPAGLSDSNVKIPFLLDLLYNFSVIFIIIVAILVAAFSLAANVDYIQIALRTAVVVIVLGFGLFGLSWFFSKCSLEAARQDMLGLLKTHQVDAESTKEVEA